MLLISLPSLAAASLATAFTRAAAAAEIIFPENQTEEAGEPPASRSIVVLGMMRDAYLGSHLMSTIASSWYRAPLTRSPRLVARALGMTNVPGRTALWTPSARASNGASADERGVQILATEP